MTLILLDRNSDVRKEAAECLEDLLASEEDRERLADVMHSSREQLMTKMQQRAKGR